MHLASAAPRQQARTRNLADRKGASGRAGMCHGRSPCPFFVAGKLEAAAERDAPDIVATRPVRGLRVGFVANARETNIGPLGP